MKRYTAATLEANAADGKRTATEEAAEKALTELVSALDAARQAQEEFKLSVEDAELVLLAAETASASFAKALDRVNEASDLDFSQMALDTVESFDSMKSALGDLEDVAVDWATVDLTPDSVEELRGIPDELAKVTDGIAGMRDSIQTELQAAFDTGGIDAYTSKAAFFRDEILAQYPQAFRDAGAGAEEADRLTADLVADLGLLPRDVEIMIALTHEEEARRARRVLRGNRTDAARRPGRDPDRDRGGRYRASARAPQRATHRPRVRPDRPPRRQRTPRPPRRPSRSSPGRRSLPLSSPSREISPTPSPSATTSSTTRKGRSPSSTSRRTRSERSRRWST